MKVRISRERKVCVNASFSAFEGGERTHHIITATQTMYLQYNPSPTERQAKAHKSDNLAHLLAPNTTLKTPSLSCAFCKTTSPRRCRRMISKSPKGFPSAQRIPWTLICCPTFLFSAQFMHNCGQKSDRMWAEKGHIQCDVLTIQHFHKHFFLQK